MELLKIHKNNIKNSFGSHRNSSDVEFNSKEVENLIATSFPRIDNKEKFDSMHFEKKIPELFKGDELINKVINDLVSKSSFNNESF